MHLPCRYMENYWEKKIISLASSVFSLTIEQGHRLAVLLSLEVLLNRSRIMIKVNSRLWPNVRP